jgi:ligand-binding SRPBCC domain-containing protein
MSPEITRTSLGYRLRTETILPRPRAEAFEFFSDCHNLERLTPSELRFHVLTPDPVVMHAGAIIDYRLRLGGIPFGWKTEITTWDPPHSFTDTQLRGPYRRWIHLHEFHDEGDVTRMIDQVDFLAPGGPLVHALFVNRKVRQIFGHRTRRFAELFPDRPA